MRTILALLLSLCSVGLMAGYGYTLLAPAKAKDSRLVRIEGRNTPLYFPADPK